MLPKCSHHLFKHGIRQLYASPDWVAPKSSLVEWPQPSGHIVSMICNEWGVWIIQRRVPCEGLLAGNFSVQSQGVIAFHYLRQVSIYGGYIRLIVQCMDGPYLFACHHGTVFLVKAFAGSVHCAISFRFAVLRYSCSGVAPLQTSFLTSRKYDRDLWSKF